MPAQDLQGLRILPMLREQLLLISMSIDKSNFLICRKSIIDLLSQYDDGKIESFDENMVADTVFRIKDVLNVSDVDFLKSVLERKLDAEFNEQVCNIFSEDDGEIQLQIKDKIITVSVEK